VVKESKIRSTLIVARFLSGSLILASSIPSIKLFFSYLNPSPISASVFISVLSIIKTKNVLKVLILIDIMVHLVEVKNVEDFLFRLLH